MADTGMDKQQREDHKGWQSANKAPGVLLKYAHDPESPVDSAWIWTRSGKKMHFKNPLPGLSITDIAHALSNLCRWTGQCDEFYSVAQHSVLVSHQVNQSMALHALLHDAAEAYTNDMNKPIKALLKGYDEIADNIQRAVYLRYCGELPILVVKEAIKSADLTIAATEARDLLRRVPDLDYFKGNKPIEARIQPMAPYFAKGAFLERFLELM